MSATSAFLRHELRTQIRSLRFRVLAAVYLLAGSAPAGLISLSRETAWQAVGGASYARETTAVLPLLTAILAVLLSLDGINREREEGVWSTITLAGMSNAGYLLRRWLALQAIVLPLTAAPLMAAWGIAFAQLGTPPSPAPFLGPWLLQIAPLAFAASTLALSLSTIAGGAINTLLLGGLVLGLLPGLANVLLARFRIHLGSLTTVLDLPLIQFSISRMGGAFDPGVLEGWSLPFPVPESESALDVRVLAEQALAELALPLALATAGLGIAMLYLRRTRPDVRPWRIAPRHPLRTFLVAVSRLRERFTPDPAPSRADLAALGTALLVAVALVTAVLGRFEHYRGLAAERFQAERDGGPAPMSPDVVPGRFRIEGRLGPGAEVDLTVTAEMRNVGGEPRGHLAFMLDPALAVKAAAADQGRAAISRRWDRLAVELDPPIPPGGRREVRLHLTGSPGTTALTLLQRGSSGWNFQRAFADHLGARFGRELSDLSRSYRVPAISGRRVDLPAQALAPVPRYLPWTLIGDAIEEDNLVVPEETLLPVADLEIALSVPPDLFLADACGQIARQGRLASRCRLPVAELSVVGGSQRVLDTTAAGPAVAVFPGHAAQAEIHLGFLTQGGRILEEAWPGLGSLETLVVLEWPDARVHDLRGPFRNWRSLWGGYGELPIQVRGNVVLLREQDLSSLQPIKPETLVAEVVAAKLSRRRPLAADDAVFFRNLFKAMALERLGMGSPAGAVFGPLRGDSGAMHVPPSSEPWVSYWFTRFPALVAALENRAGAEALRGSVDELLALSGDRPGTAAELFTILKRRSEAPLDRMIHDFFVVGAIPEPVLDGVDFKCVPEGWRVSGRLLNRGDGEALCRIVLTTDLGPVEATVSAGTGEAAPFTLSTAHRPQAVLLDPDNECHRVIPKGAPRDRVFFREKR